MSADLYEDLEALARGNMSDKDWTLVVRVLEALASPRNDTAVFDARTTVRRWLRAAQ